MTARTQTALPADFAEFVAASSRPLLGFAHALTANPHDAWDLTQETLARMGERWDRATLEQPLAYARPTRSNTDRRAVPGPRPQHRSES